MSRSIIRLALGVLLAAAMTRAANAACQTWTNLQNNTTADASKVMGNFNYIIQCPDFTGSVGIGTLTPLAPLHVVGPVSGGAIYSTDTYNAMSFGISPYGGGLVDISAGVTSQSGNWIALNNSSLAGQVMRMYPGMGVQWYAESGTANGSAVSSWNSAQGVTLWDDKANWKSLVQSTYAGTSYFSGNLGIGTISPSTTLYVNGSAGGTQPWNGSSDRRLKKNVRPIENALAVVEQIQGVRFNWRKPSERSVGQALNLPVNRAQVGFIAQDLEKILPEAVTTTADSEGLKSVAESKVVPFLVEAVKELKASNDKLSSDLHEHEARFDKQGREMQKLQEANAALRARFSAVDRRLDAIEARLASIRGASVRRSVNTAEAGSVRNNAN